MWFDVIHSPPTGKGPGVLVLHAWWGLNDTNHLQAKAEIAAATMFLDERVGQTDRGLAVIGFSLGAYYALDLKGGCSCQENPSPLNRF